MKSPKKKWLQQTGFLVVRNSVILHKSNNAYGKLSMFVIMHTEKAAISFVEFELPDIYFTV